MERIVAENTALYELSNGELTPEIILTGEQLEFDPEKKPNVRKYSYVRHDFATQMLEAYASDLLSAYRVIEDLEAAVRNLQDELDQTRTVAETSTTQVKQLVQGDQKFADAERLLAQFEQQLEMLAKDKQADKQTIAELTGQIQELEELRETVPQLQSDVGTVLDNLRSYFEEEGLDIPDGEY